MPIDLTFPAQVAEVLGGIAVIIAVIQLVTEVRRRRRERAALVTVWAAASTDRAEFKGLRGVVISNGTGAVIENVDVAVQGGAGSKPLRDVYPLVPPGTHFLTLRDEDAEPAKDAKDAANVEVLDDEAARRRAYVLIPTAGADEGVCVHLPGANDQSSMSTHDLVPWHNPDRDDDLRSCKEFSFDLAGETWRHDGRSLRRLCKRAKAKLVASRDDPSTIGRRFPGVAIRAEAKAEEQVRSESRRDAMKALMDGVAEVLCERAPVRGKQPVALKPKYQLAGPTITLRRSVGMGVELQLDRRPAYWFAPNKYGDVPDVFDRSAKADQYFSVGKSLKGHTVFSNESQWAPGDLAAAIMAVVREDLQAAGASEIRPHSADPQS